MNTNQNSTPVQATELNPFQKSSGEKKYLKAMKKVFKKNGQPGFTNTIKVAF